jgi:WD40 repeat protein
METYPIGPDERENKTHIAPNDNNIQTKTMKTFHSLAVGLRPAFLILARRIAFLLLLLGAGLALIQPCAGQSGTWTATGSLATARWGHTATLLLDGKVLVAGGIDSSFIAFASAELYDPATGTWTATGNLATARYGHTATLLPNGKVLVAGGAGDSDSLASAELYDPATGIWTTTGSLLNVRAGHTATLLPNGKVLVAGGLNSISGTLASAELYDPATGTWTATGSLTTPRYAHTATLLPNGKVLVAGGFDVAIAELYDPSTGIWTTTGSLAIAREFPTATLLPNGKVLLAGGAGDRGYVASAELYDPATGIWATTGSLVNVRAGHTATLLPNGKVLVAGGYNGFVYLASAELYDPATGIWTTTGSLANARTVPTATLLSNGKVLAAAGADDSGALASAELYASDGGGDLTLVSAASLGRGGFAIDLPLSGPSGVEDRSTLPNHRLVISMTFNNAIASVGSASSDCGSVSDITINGNTVTVKAIGVPRVCNGHVIILIAFDVMDDQGNSLSSASATVGLLLGDANGDRVVDPADRHLVKSLKGQLIDSTNFRADVSSDGYIGSADVRLVEQQQGTSLP